MGLGGLVGGFGGGALGASVVQLGLDARGLERGIADSRREVQRGTSAMEGSAGKLRAAWIGFAALAGAAVLKFGADSVRSFGESERAENQLTNTLANHIKLSDVARDSWTSQAAALQDLTGVEDEQITMGQAMLGQFNMTGREVQELIPLVIDLSQKWGIDMQGAAKAVGKAVDGSGGTLSRYGIKLDAASLKADGFGTVMEGLSAAVGGFAEQQGKTAEGRLRILAANFDDVKESVGSGLVPVVELLADALDAAMPILQFTGEHLREILLILLSFKAAAFLGGMFRGIAAGAAAMNLGAMANGANALNTGLLGMGKAIPVIGTVITVATTLGHVLRNLFFKDDIWTAEDLSEAIAGKLAPALRSTGEAGKAFRAEFDRMIDLMVRFGKLTPEQADEARAQADAMRGTGAAADELAESLDDTTDSTRDLIAAQAELANSFLGIQGAALNVQQAELRLADARKALNDLAAAGKQGTREYTDAQMDLTGAQLGAVQAQASLEGQIRSHIAAMEDQGATQTEVNAEIRRLAAEAGLTAAEVNKLIAKVTGLTGSLNDVPRFVTTKITVETAVAQSVFDAFINNISGRTIPIAVATGGYVQLPGQHAAQHGFEGIVRKPTMFMVAERGHPERVSVSPATGGLSGSAGGNRPAARGGDIIIMGDVYGWDDFKGKLDQGLGEIMAAAT